MAVAGEHGPMVADPSAKSTVLAAIYEKRPRSCEGTGGRLRMQLYSLGLVSKAAVIVTDDRDRTSESADS